MMVKRFTVGRFFTNCYVVASEETGEAIVIDPGFEDQTEAERTYRFIESKALDLRFIVNTHGHLDHTCGNGMVKERFQVPILIHEYDADMLKRLGDKFSSFFGFKASSPPADRLLHQGDSVDFGNIALNVVHTPGHTRGGVSLLGDQEVFTGDTLFAGSIGRMDFPESSKKEMQLSLRKLANLPGHLVVYPGHGPKTTIREERAGNPFLRSL